MNSLSGNFIISLDFELFWGIHDEKYNTNDLKSFENTIYAISEMKKLFKEFNINVTFSTVGFLFANSISEIRSNTPIQLPNYTNKNQSPYTKLNELNKINSKILFAKNIIETIKNNKNFEIGSHTFSHYYCLEEGQNITEFNEDLKSAIKIAKKYNIELKSIVFPRNQYNEAILKTCYNNGIICYRGNENSWVYKSEAWSKESLLKKGVRFIDSYINLSGHHGFKIKPTKSKIDKPINIPSSKFLRPFNKKLKLLEKFKLKRIKQSMSYCALNNLNYHLWWHPHNFKSNTKENIDNLKEILKHYKQLEKKYGFKSKNMIQITKEHLNEL